MSYRSALDGRDGAGVQSMLARYQAGPLAAKPGAASRAWRCARVIRDCLLVALALSASLALARAYAHNHGFAGDYQVNAWQAGYDLFHNLSVYVVPNSPEVTHFALFDWGPVSAVLFAPLSLLPYSMATLVFVLFCIGSVGLTLAVLNVRDWRIYCVVFMWPFVMLGWVLGNVELPMALGLALAWRYRNRPGIVGVVVAILISVKFIVFPIALWLFATRRYAALARTVLWGLVINLVAWAIVGFGEIKRYLALLPAVARVARWRGTGVISLCVHLRASPFLSEAIALSIAVLLAVVCLQAGREGADLSALALAILICLVATPIMEPHYYTLLVVPLAIARPRFGAIWGVPLLLWLSLAAGGQWGTMSTTLVCLGVMTCLVAPAIRGCWPKPAVAKGSAETEIVASADPSTDLVIAAAAFHKGPTR